MDSFEAVSRALRDRPTWCKVERKAAAAEGDQGATWSSGSWQRGGWAESTEAHGSSAKINCCVVVAVDVGGAVAAVAAVAAAFDVVIVVAVFLCDHHIEKTILLQSTTS